VHGAANQISSDSEKLYRHTTSLAEHFDTKASNTGFLNLVAFGFGGVALLLLGMLGFRLVRDAGSRTKVAESQNREQQEAILRLLDEIQGLSEGDLTAQAVVTEDFTGAIADAFNSSIEELRKLVATINETSVQVSSAAQETQATAMHLAEASDHQASQITSVSQAINEMAGSIEEVSRNAAESSKVAQNSVKIAHAGVATVRRNIQGMDSIREQIQETSKRIKRLGESSQEIGDIIELINDIADQTNILSLNAAIQAAMAGEAGRGFAVVADEVQRLAERSSNATKQIEALVKTIQTDTNEAVISMEQSTAGVVKGAKMAEDAGEALAEIESVSNRLAELIQNISENASQQSRVATSISETMNVIQEITTQTSAGTNETAASIGNLADLANDLRKSVSGFKLPDNMQK
jgi:twitching motility protein PilJ